MRIADLFRLSESDDGMDDEEEERANHNDHAAALRQTGFWGRQGAGGIFLARNTGRFLISHRSDEVEEPETWGTWGGAIDRGLTPVEAARKEARQECGYRGEIEFLPMFVFRAGTFIYNNFLMIIDEEFTPRLNWETQGYVWCRYGDWPAPLHPGLEKLLADPASQKIMLGELRKFGKAPRPARPKRRPGEP